MSSIFNAELRKQCKKCQNVVEETHEIFRYWGSITFFDFMTFPFCHWTRKHIPTTSIVSIVLKRPCSIMFTDTNHVGEKILENF